MPNKQKNHLYTRPSASPLSLSKLSTGSQQSQRIEEDNCSVAGRLRSLRYHDARRLPHRPPPMATVHPSLRNILDVPDNPQPRPRPGMQMTVNSRIQRIPGPAAPPSWHLPAARHDPNIAGSKHEGAYKGLASMSVSVNERPFLPGARCPSRNSLLHAALKAMAEQWDWHLRTDHIYLASLARNVREILLTYVATYATDGVLERSHDTLRMLFPGENDLNGWHGSYQEIVASSSEVVRLDLSRAIGIWVRKTSSLKKELLRAHVARGLVGPWLESVSVSSRPGAIEPPESWDDTDPTPNERSTQGSFSVPLESPQVPRFHNLRHLSLNLSVSMAHSKSVASWSSLLSMTSQLSTLESLALESWPCPTLTPQAAAVSATIRNPLSNSLPRVPYGGTDMYTESDSNWREAAGILRRLSQNLYCLKWLDLTGCGAWFGALSWTDTQIVDDVLGLGTRLAETGPDWNGSWRNIEYLALGVGWAPPSLDNSGQVFISSTPSAGDHNLSSSAPTSRKWRDPLLSSGAKGSAPLSSKNAVSLIKQDWDGDEERRKYVAKKQLERFKVTQARAHEVATHLRALRESARGKWIEVAI